MPSGHFRARSRRRRIMRVRKLAMLILAMASVAPVAALAQQQPQQGGKDAVYDELNLFDEAFERIRQDAVDPVGDSKLVGAAITGMLTGLDPHASYIDPAALKALNGPAASGEVGIGAALTLTKGELKVISPRDGSPAAAVGIKPGDLILAIDKEPTYELTLAEAEQKLRGPAGSTVGADLAARRGKRAAQAHRSSAPPSTCRPSRRGSRTAISAICGWPGSTPARTAALAAAAAGFAPADRRQARRRRRRPAQQSGRQFQGRGRRRQRLSRQGRRGAGQGAQLRQCQAHRRHPERPRQRAADRRPGQRRHRRRGRVGGARVAGQSPRPVARHQNLWRECHRNLDPAGQRRRHPADHRPLYDTGRARDRRQGPRPRPRQ